MPYTILNFGTGSHRVQGKRSSVPPLTDAQAFAPDYRQESAIPTKGESHGGTDVWLGAIGHGAEAFRGTLDNTSVYTLVKQAAGL